MLHNLISSMLILYLPDINFMTDFTKGGRGKKAPYETEMYRVPTPIKETVQQLAAAFKRVCEGNSGITPSHLLTSVQSAIARAAYPQSDLESPTNLISTIEDKCTSDADSDAVERLEVVKELLCKWKGKSRDTRNWTEANRLLKELEEALFSAEE